MMIEDCFLYDIIKASKIRKVAFDYGKCLESD